MAMYYYFLAENSLAYLLYSFCQPKLRSQLIANSFFSTVVIYLQTLSYTESTLWNMDLKESVLITISQYIS